MAGRPDVKIDWVKLDEYLRAGCDGVSIASFIGCHPNTLYHRVMDKYGCDFSSYRAQKMAEGNDLIRLAQMNKALHSVDANGNVGDNTMLIWLGKQRLDQKERAHNEVSTPEGKRIIIEVHDAGCQAEGDQGLPTP